MKTTKKTFISFCLLSLSILLVFIVVKSIQKTPDELTKEQRKVVEKVLDTIEDYENFDITLEYARENIDFFKERFDSLPCMKSNDDERMNILFKSHASCISSDILQLSIDLLLGNDYSEIVSRLKNY